MFRFKLKDENVYNFLKTIYSDEEIQKRIFEAFKIHDSKACFDLSLGVSIACEFDAIDLVYIEEEVRENDTAFTWLPYPQNKPPRTDCTYLVTLYSGNANADRWEEDGWAVFGKQVIAFAEAPEPYQA